MPNIIINLYCVEITRVLQKQNTSRFHSNLNKGLPYPVPSSVIVSQCVCVHNSQCKIINYTIIIIVIDSLWCPIL